MTILVLQRISRLCVQRLCTDERNAASYCCYGKLCTLGNPGPVNHTAGIAALRSPRSQGFRGFYQLLPGKRGVVCQRNSAKCIAWVNRRKLLWTYGLVKYINPARNLGVLSLISTSVHVNLLEMYSLFLNMSSSSFFSFFFSFWFLAYGALGPPSPLLPVIGISRFLFTYFSRCFKCLHGRKCLV